MPCLILPLALPRVPLQHIYFTLFTFYFIFYTLYFILPRVPLQHMDWLCFVGQLLGLALRQKDTQLSLSLPPLIWKQLVDQAALPYELYEYI